MTRECGRILENDTELLSLYSTSKLTSLCGSAKVLEEKGGGQVVEAQSVGWERRTRLLF
jgi:hypothetical protein